MTLFSILARSAIVVAACAFVLTYEATAQTGFVRWDSLGLGSTEAFAVLPGPHPNGQLDTLVARGGIPDTTIWNGYRYDMVRLLPDEVGWREDICLVGICDPTILQVLPSGTLLGAATSGPTRVIRSVNGGRTWQRSVAPTHAHCFLQSTLPSLGGAVLACGREDPDDQSPDPPRRVWRSLDDGRAGSWEPLGAIENPGDFVGWIEALAEVPESAALPNGRLVVGVANGIAFSDDGAESWQISALWKQFGWWVYSFAVVPDPSMPYGATVLAGLGDFGRGVSGVWASEDGGQTWEERVLWPGLGAGDRTQLVAGADGAVYAATNDIAPDPNMGKVYRSRDAGKTWEDISSPETGWGRFGTYTLLIGRDGRLYAATDGGVWQTADPLTVASEAGPVETAGVALRVEPNPSSGSTRVRLTLDAPKSNLMVAVFDALGREVSVSASGPLTAGEHAFEVEASEWAPGTYVVRVQAGASMSSTSFTVVR